MAEGTKLITHRDLIQLMLDRMIEVHKLLKTQMERDPENLELKKEYRKNARTIVEFTRTLLNG